MKQWRNVKGMIVAMGLLYTPFFLIGCAGGERDGPTTVRVDGSSTVFPITEAVAEEFQKRHPDIRVYRRDIRYRRRLPEILRR